MNPTHDGYTTDHVAEFCFMRSADQIQVLCEADFAGYEHSLASFLHTLLLSPEIAIPPRTRNPEAHGLLVRSLGSACRLDSRYTISESRDSSPNLVQLINAWPRICRLMSNSPGLQAAIAGHLRREVWYEAKTRDSRRVRYQYYLPGAGFALPPSLRAHFEAVVNAACEMHTWQPGEPVRSWIQTNLATHFLNYLDRKYSIGENYVPGLTRVELARSRQKSVILPESIRKSFAYDMIRKAKRRQDLIPSALQWLDSRAGRTTRRAYVELNAKLNGQNPEEARSVLKEIKLIEEASTDRATDLFFAFVVFGLALASMPISAVLGGAEAIQKAIATGQELIKKVNQPKFLTVLYREKKNRGRFVKKLRTLLTRK